MLFRSVYQSQGSGVEAIPLLHIGAAQAICCDGRSARCRISRRALWCTIGGWNGDAETIVGVQLSYKGAQSADNFVIAQVQVGRK